MGEYSIEELNSSSMQIILHAGNARELYNEALDQAEAGMESAVGSLLDAAEQEVVCAHRIQTRLIQGAIEQEHPDMTVLFIHAQDTLMSVDSEYRLVKRLIKLYGKLAEMGER